MGSKNIKIKNIFLSLFMVLVLHIWEFFFSFFSQPVATNSVATRGGHI